MGSRSAVDTPARALLAFHRRRQWRQADLARELGVSVEAVLRTLRALEKGGMPLQRDDTDKPHVWWKVPKDWVPQGVLFPREQTAALLRVLARAPASKERDALLAHASQSARASDARPRVVASPLSELEAAWLPLVEDASRGVTLGMRYVGTKRAGAEWRYASVQHVDVGPPSRFIAVCHRDGKLKEFRVDGIQLARLDPTTAYRAADPAAVQKVLRERIAGFHRDAEPVECAFGVRAADAGWVARNLPAGLTVDADAAVKEGIRVRCRTAAVRQVARFVVGLGQAATVETPELAASVRELAEQALKGLEAAAPMRPKGLKAKQRAG